MHVPSIAMAARLHVVLSAALKACLAYSRCHAVTTGLTCLTDVEPTHSLHR